MDIEFE
jgi:uncharacterized protein